MPAAGQRSAAWLACPGNLPTVLLPYSIPESQLTAPRLSNPSCIVDTGVLSSHALDSLHNSNQTEKLPVQRPLSTAMHTTTSCRQMNIIAQHQQGPPTVQYTDQLMTLWL